MSDLRREIIKSPEAERFLQMITKDFYNNSRTGLWMFESIGREYDDMAKWSRELKYETRPQTCTWSISIWEFIYDIESDENLPLEYRRQQILAKRLSRPPINPARIEFVLLLKLLRIHYSMPVRNWRTSIYNNIPICTTAAICLPISEISITKIQIWATTLCLNSK